MSVSVDEVINALRPIQDPDLRRSIVDLKFIQNIDITTAHVSFDLVLTTPACPVKDLLKASCVEAVSALPGVESVEVVLKAETRGAPLAGRNVLEGVRNIVAVASGKGGVAKSTTAVNLAVGLAQAGARVGLFDADIYGPSVPTMIAVDQEPRMIAEQRIQPALGLGVKIISIGFFIPPGKAAILRGPMVSGYISQFLKNVEWGELDYLIIDYPPGTGDIQLTLSQQASVSAAVICTTPQEVSLVDVRKALSMFETTRIPVLGIVETMSYFVCGTCQSEHHIFGEGGARRLCEESKLPLLGRIPIDANVAKSGDEGRPVLIEFPDSAAATSYRDLVGSVAASLSTLSMGASDQSGDLSLTWQS